MRDHRMSKSKEDCSGKQAFQQTLLEHLRVHTLHAAPGEREG